MSNMTNDADIAALRDDFNALRKDMTALLDHVRGNVANNVGNASTQMSTSARDLYSTATTNGEETAKVVYQRIEDHPIVAALLVLGVAYAGCRMLARS